MPRKNHRANDQSRPRDDLGYREKGLQKKKKKRSSTKKKEAKRRVVIVATRTEDLKAHTEKIAAVEEVTNLSSDRSSFAACCVRKDREIPVVPKDPDEIRRYFRTRRGLEDRSICTQQP
jgi:hypothetical protein